jgi:isopenicillin N synthase-like dioxygenase
MQHVGFVYLAASPLEALRQDIFALSHTFFALPRETRMRIAMEQSAAFRYVTRRAGRERERVSGAEEHTRRGGGGRRG